MSATTHEQGVTLPRVVRSEWIKFVSLRSSWFTLLAAVLIMVAFGALTGYDMRYTFATREPEDAAVSQVLEGYVLAQLLIGGLGVLVVSGEYGTGMIRSTLTAVPRRLPVLLGKAIAFGVFALLSMVATTFATFGAAQAYLYHYGHGYSLSDPGVLRTVVATGGYLALIGLFGAALGWILRSTAAGLVGLFVILLVLPTLLQAMPWDWAFEVARYLPTVAGGSLVRTIQAPDSLTPGAGLAVLTGWVLGMMAIAAVLLKRRDS